MFSCKQVDELISQSLDTRLSWRKRIIIKMHMRVCTYCQSYHRQMEALREAVRCYKASLESGGCAEETKLPDDARERIKKSLKEE